VAGHVIRMLLSQVKVADDYKGHLGDPHLRVVHDHPDAYVPTIHLKLLNDDLIMQHNCISLFKRITLLASKPTLKLFLDSEYYNCE
jgi:hypothetical protein